MTRYFADPSGRARSTSFASGNPVQGIVIPHASTQRWRVTRSSSGIRRISVSASVRISSSTRPSMTTSHGANSQRLRRFPDVLVGAELVEVVVACGNLFRRLREIDAQAGIRRRRVEVRRRVAFVGRGAGNREQRSRGRGEAAEAEAAQYRAAVAEGRFGRRRPLGDGPAGPVADRHCAHPFRRCLCVRRYGPFRGAIPPAITVC